jgi:formylglycine-generating enzyme
VPVATAPAAPPDALPAAGVPELPPGDSLESLCASVLHPIWMLTRKSPSSLIDTLQIRGACQQSLLKVRFLPPSIRGMPARPARYLLAGALTWACGPSPASEAHAGCSTPCAVECESELSGVCADLAPAPQLRFHVDAPVDAGDSVFNPASPPTSSVPLGARVFLSAQGSADPEGEAVRIFWNVQDASNLYLPIEPEPTAEQASFTGGRAGQYRVTLQVTELTGLHQTTEIRLQLLFAPQPCAADGASPPCADELLVEGGTFLIGSPDASGFASEYPQHDARVGSFLLDQYEVTVGRFRGFVTSYDPASLREAAGANPLLPGSGWHTEWLSKLPESAEELGFAIAECGGTWTDDAAANEARPISCVTWFEAAAFCAAEGKRLPTEAEWEYAASGGSEQRLYPWGNEAPSVERAVFGCLFDGDSACTDGDLPVVGSLPQGAGRFGQLDLAGSVWEWTQDAYAPYAAGNCDECAVLATDESARVFRGGDYKFEDPASLRASTRYAFLPTFPDPTRGFRCARSPATQRGWISTKQKL